MKEEINKDEELAKWLAHYEVTVPTKKLAMKQTSYQRFIRYLGSPAKDPLENLADSTQGFHFLKLFPLAAYLFLAILQGIMMF